MRGKFITFEGSEGSGKSTQSKLLVDYLKRKGCSLVYLREPGGTKISEKIRKLLLDPQNESMVKETEMLLYMAARAQIVQEIIKPAIRAGKLVICDRFLDSTLAYQGFGLGISLDLIRSVGKFACQGLKPNLTIFLDLPVSKGLGYRRLKSDRIERRSLAYHSRVRRGYLKLAKQEPQRMKIVKLDHDITVTQRKIRKLVSDKLCLLAK